LFGGMLIADVEARPADQVNAVDKLKNLELREIGPAVMGGALTTSRWWRVIRT